ASLVETDSELVIKTFEIQSIKQP
ncbi:MAG: hypothetical protein US45_C0018G0019, partial [Candidatus Nomurabacteria bacterium GW2011_GWA1_37_20]